MSNSLKDALLGLGFKAVPEPPKKPKTADSRPPQGKRSQESRPPQGKRSQESRPPQGKRPSESRGPQDRRPAQARPAQGRPAQRAPGSKPAARPEFDLGKAFALRAQHEKDERIAIEAAKQEEARLRREARAKLAELLKDNTLNDPAAEHVRHFEYGGKIKRVHVTPGQLAALNKGELGVLQSEGRYVLVTAEVLAQAKEIFAAAVALEVDPDAPAPADDYADPKFQIPDDLSW